jgi:hypothetical protein
MGQAAAARDLHLSGAMFVSVVKDRHDALEYLEISSISLVHRGPPRFKGHASSFGATSAAEHRRALEPLAAAGPECWARRPGNDGLEPQRPCVRPNASKD